MRSYFWKFVLCFTPILLAGWVTWSAIMKYVEGDPGGFKMGVDLVGGTILVYEIDLRKTAASKNEKGEASFDPVRDINVLAEALKRRIDPNDLYNIIIRPAGGEGRVEIILPTGGIHRTRKAQQEWNKILQSVQEHFGIKDDLRVARGRVLELADKVQLLTSENLWATKLLGNPQAWERLVTSKDEPQFKQAPKSVLWMFGADIKKVQPEIEKLKPGEVDALSRIIFDALARTDSPTSEIVIKTWVKQHAWNELLRQVLDYKTRRTEKLTARVKGPSGKDVEEEFSLEFWPDLTPFQDELKRIPPDNNDQLATFILSKGNVYGQAGLSVLTPLIGTNPLVGDPESVDPRAVKDFIRSRYGPSHREIVDEINELAKAMGRSRDLNVEEVQKIKDLVSRVGLLEFRILANKFDDADGISAAEKALDMNIPRIREEMKRLAENGLPPPAPEGVYNITTARGNKSNITYSWVEVGRQMRRELNLDNSAKDDPTRDRNWKFAETRIDQAFQLPDPFSPSKDAHLLHGALFFKRECKDRNLPAEERENKKWEYFVLTRDPEVLKVETTSDGRERLIRQEKIDGSHLTNAGASFADVRPSVHFSFDSVGANLFRDITRKNVPDEGGTDTNRKLRHLAIILDGLVMSAPTIQSEIGGSGQITGSFTSKEVNELVNILRAGRLPATLKPQPVSESTMAPTLGQDTIRSGLIAVVLAFGAVMAFMIVYYRFAGMVAAIALLSNLLLTIGFMVAVQATFTLPGLAGLVLMLGMAVDANILIYERIREERERGTNMALAIRSGYERSTATIMDTHLSSVFTAIVLYVVGNDALKGFGVSLTVGLLVSLFTTLYMTRVFFDFWYVKGWLKKLSMLRFFARPNIDFMAIRKPMFVTTVTLAVLGFALFFGRAPFNIDFVGGTAFGGKLAEPVSIGELRELVDETRQKELLKVTVVEDEQAAPAKTADGKETETPSVFGTGRYFLTYEGSTEPPRLVTLVNPPELPTAKERAEAVQKRASKLPDASVEQLFPSFEEQQGGKSRFFSIRTSEKEAELVQAAIDRLLRKDGKTLLQRVYMGVEPLQGREAVVKFYDQEPPAKGSLPEPDAFASPIFLKSFFQKEMLDTFGTDDKTKLPAYEVLGTGASSPDGAYMEMRVKFEKAPTAEETKRISQAIQQTMVRFNAYIQPDRLENFDSQLAVETRYRALWAILASWVAILVYLWFRFGSWTFGLAAVVCLIHDLFITLGVIAGCHYVYGTIFGDWLLLEDFKVDLPAVAALLTLVGYSVNDTIVVFDRIREVRGKNPALNPRMINDSVNQTLSRTLLASLTTFLVVLVLYIWGGPGVHLFAFVMVIGVIVGTYSSIYIASPLLLILGEGHATESQTQRAPRLETEGAQV